MTRERRVDAGLGRLLERGRIIRPASDLARARVLYAAQGRVADTLFASKTTNAAWRSKPSWYAVSKQDRTTAPELQRFLAARMKAKTIELDSSHLSIVTHAKEVADLISEAAGRS